jgi:hypothetical protein
MPFPNEGGHGHDVGWHIWPVCILELKIFEHQSIIFGLQKRFCKVSDGASNATKISQINEGMTKICLFQMKGVMGMMWVGT